MTTNFDWQTDENDAWGEPIVNTTPPPPRRWHPLFLFILLTLLATPFTIFLAYQLTLRRTYNTHQNAVIAVQTYLHDGLNDPERLAPLFLPDDKRWFNDQTDILTANLFLDRHQLGLTWQTANLTPPPTINFNPNYTQATFTLTHQYQTPQQQTITLNQRHTYQRRQGQWYYTNPYPDETWGDWVNLEYDNLLIVTPQRDQEISQRLANNLHTLLLDLCQNEHLNCPHNHQLQIRFDNDTNSLLHLDEYFARLRLRSGFNQFNLKLPTPSLVGLPTDEASYQALYHGYASWIAGVLISNYGDNFLHLQSAEADTLLAAYNLTMPPRPQPAPPNLAPPPILPNHLTLPDQDMLILCAEPPELTLWQYNFSQNKWHLSYQKDIAPGSFQHALYPVPEQNGALFQTTTYNPETQSQQWQLFWWQADAEPTPLLSSPQLLNIMRQSQRYSFIQNDHYFVGFEFIDRDGNNNLYFHWFDCQQGNCTVNEASGYPLWSPNKDHFLVWNITADKAELSFANPDGTPQQFIANAIALSWLNDNELAYVESIPQEDRSPRNVLKQYNLNQKAVTAELLDETDIYPLLPRRVRTHNLTISSITPIPNSDNWLLVVHTSTRRDDDLHLLQFNPITQDLQLLLVNNDSEPFTFRQPYWRDNGRYLIIPTLQNSILFGLTVFDYQQQTSRIIPAITPVYDWSADEEWILTQSGFSLQLESFTADITYPFLTEQHCQDAIWLK